MPVQFPLSFPRRSPFRCRLALPGLLLLVALAPPAAAAEPLTLAETARIAATRAPAIVGAEAALAAAEVVAPAAGELPDPELVLGIDSLPLSGPARFSLSRDEMTAQHLGIAQRFPGAGKRRLRREAAEAATEMAAARLAALRREAAREASRAWLERHFTERELEILATLAPELDSVAEAARALFAGGGQASAADVVAAAALRADLDDRIDSARRSEAAARAALVRWIGPDAASRPLAPAPDFAAVPGGEHFDDAPQRQPALLPYFAAVDAASSAVALARAERRPDWSVELGYARRGPGFDDMLSLQFRIDLPLFPARRQDAQLAARLAEQDASEAARDDAIRQWRERLERTLAERDEATRRLARQRETLLPLAEERAALSLAAWRGGQGDIQPVLAARTALVEARLDTIARERALALATIELAALAPQEETP